MRWIFLLAAFSLAAQTPDYSRDVRPLLAAKCLGCHNARLKQGGLALASHHDVTEAKVKLMDRVQGIGGAQMPLNGAPLSPSEMDLLRRWISAGAPGPATAEKPSWSAPLALKPTERPPDQAHEQVGDSLFARRAYLDIWGLLPEPGEIEAFERDARPEKRAALVDRLLSVDHRYAAHWISFWNDHLRNDEGVVYHGERKSITSWLFNALKANMSYRDMVRTLLNPPENSGAEGFLTGVTWRGEINASQTPAMQAAQNSAQVFLGINLKCNSCHDSFISQWKLKDAYGLASFFSAEPLPIYRCDTPAAEMATAKFLYPELGSPPAGARLSEKRAVAADLFTKPENGRTPRTIVNRYWKALMGRGIVDTVDDMDVEPANPQLLDWLASDFVAHEWDLKHLIRTIMTLPAYGAPQMRRLTAEQFVDAVASITGEWPVSKPNVPGPGIYMREWQRKASPPARALGRPIRDQVVTERVNTPATLDALELMNGEALARQLRRGARRMMGLLRESPRPAFDSGVMNSKSAEVNMPLNGAKRVWLLIEDVDSYDPKRVRAGWANLSLGPANGTLLFKGESLPRPATLMSVPGVLELETNGAETLTATVGVAAESLASDINPRVRFLAFTTEPDRESLIPPQGAPPSPLPPALSDAGALVIRIYRHALSREPSDAELRIAREFLSDGEPEGLEDLLWSVLLTPEFQYVR